MIVLERIADLRARCESERHAGRRVGLVPTMGYLHEGHRSLMRAARRDRDFVVLTIFVNPLQFGPGEDLDAYPRDLEGDLAAAEAEGVDVVFAPTVREMYPGGERTTVHVDGLTQGMCGAARPTHFDGVTTVVAKLFSIVGPSAAYFGRKDFQQLAVIRQMARDLDLPVDVVGCPLVREPDGLAMSSRNAYLGSEEREAATVLSRALWTAARAVADGERDASALHRLVTETVATEARVALEYVEIRYATDLAPVRELVGEIVIALAAVAGGTRLIDNVTLNVSGTEVVTDLGVTVEPSALERVS